MPHLPLLIRFVVLSYVALQLTGCSTTPPTVSEAEPAAPAATQTPPAAAGPDLTQAIAAESAGNYAAAAEIYLAAAQSAAPPVVAELQLKAISALYKASKHSEAAELGLSLLSAAGLSEKQHNELGMLVAEQALQRQDAQLALQALSLLAPAQLAQRQQQLYFQYRADAFALQQQPENVFLNLSSALSLTHDLHERELLEMRLWSTLTQLTRPAVSSLRKQNITPTARGWLDLVEIYHNRGKLSARMDLQITQWQASYPEHPASARLIASFAPAQEEVFFQPKVVGVLLPDSGAFAPAAKAIRNGLIAAFMESAGAEYRPELRFYDSGELAEQMNSAYDRAVAEGAELIIGPLIKEHVSTLAQREALPVPTLALNLIEMDNALANLYLFALSPEQDAEQVAHQALADGHTHALTLAPQNAWGKRLTSAFAASWQQDGRTVSANQTFDPSGQDLAAALQFLLKVDESSARITALKQLLGKDLQAEPRPRHDIDFIFLAATPAQARQIRPHLRYINAENLPIYATSHIYTGTIDPTNDHDMNGILFCDMPWMLQPNALWDKIAAQWPVEAPNFKRLYAFGVDSYNVIPHLRRLSAYQGQQFEGQTGVLTINARQHVVRQLLWAKFVAGTPVVQTPAP